MNKLFKEKLDAVEKYLIDYISSYDLNVNAIYLKYIHTMNVKQKSIDIATDLKLDEENIYLSGIIGLLHDFSRFEQWKKFASFSDIRTFDHADRACEILFEEEKIKEMPIDKKYYNVINFAVKNHNKLKIQQNVPFDKNFDLMQHARIIRDSDKLDILRIVSETIQLSHRLDQKGDGLSKEVLNDFKKGNSINLKFVENRADEVVLKLSFYFDINYDYSRKEYWKNKYHYNTLEAYKNVLSGNDYKDINLLVDELNQRIIQQLA